MHTTTSTTSRITTVIQMEAASNSKQHIILVHGACHGAWSWYKVAVMLRSEGYRVTMPDLAASGIDHRQMTEVPTFADYTQPLLEIMQSLPADEMVILVGHSLGGLSIALAMEKFPEKVAAGVFLTAFLPDCASPPSMPIEKWANWITDWYDIEFKSVEQRNFMLFGPQSLVKMLYQCCQPEDVTLATTLVRFGSLFQEDLQVQPPFSKSKYGSVDKFYIVCKQDRTLSAKFQESMINNYPVKEVNTIDGADHMPMLSTPKELTQYLMDIATIYA